MSDEPGLPQSKIFCIGAGKTGTTSLESFFRSLRFRVGDQATGELLLHEWAVRNFAPIISLAHTAEFFQDIPFSCPFTFQVLDTAFSGSKFILSIRDDPEQWFGSVIRFHTQIIGKGSLPTADDLREFPYRYKGWLWDALKLVYGVSEEEPYQKDNLIDWYIRHNDEVKRYFINRKKSLLVINVSDGTAAQQIMEFVGLTYNGEQMPHLNQSSDTVPSNL